MTPHIPPFSDFQADCKQPISKDTINVVSRRVRSRSKRTESLYTYTCTHIHIQIHSSIYTEITLHSLCRDQSDDMNINTAKKTL